jgi:hypothetical protein
MTEQEQNGNDEPRTRATALSQCAPLFAGVFRRAKNDFLSPIDGLIGRF